MKFITHKLRTLALAAGTLAVTATGAKAAEAGVYAANDLLMFFQNPAQTGGTIGQTSLVYFNLGSTRNVFRDAATPNSIAFGSTISLGNINTILGSTYGANWSSPATNSIYFGAAGQAGSTGATSTGVSSGDYARTVYVTKSRTSAGSVGQANSASPVYDPAQTALAGQIAGANNVATNNQPGVVGDGDTLLDGYNPFFNGSPATAYGVLNGGIMSSVSTNSYSYGSLNGVVGALDLYRVTQTSGGVNDNRADNWQVSNNIASTYSSDYNGLTSSGYYLGTITLSSSGDVNFTAVPEPSTYALLALAAAGLAAHVIRRRKIQS